MQSPALWHDMGGFFARLDMHLAGFQHPALHRRDDWDLARAPEVIADHLPWTTDPHRRHISAHILGHFDVCM